MSPRCTAKGYPGPDAVFSISTLATWCRRICPLALFVCRYTKIKWFWHFKRARRQTTRHTHTYIRLVEIVEVGRTSHFEAVRYPFPFLLQTQCSHLAPLTSCCGTPHALFGRGDTFEKVGDCYGDIPPPCISRNTLSNTRQKWEKQYTLGLTILQPSDLFV